MSRCRMDASDFDHGRKSSGPMVFLILHLILRLSTACEAPLPKPSSVEECDCHHNGSDVNMTCYSDVQCYNASDTDHPFSPMWAGYSDNISHHLSDDPRYKSVLRTNTLGGWGMLMGVKQSNGTADERRKWERKKLVEQRARKWNRWIQELTYGEMVIVDVIEPFDPTTLVVICLVIIIIILVCILCVICNLPFLKGCLLRCRGRKILQKRENLGGLEYDTALLYDLYDTAACNIAITLQSQLKSRGYDVASTGHVLGGQSNLSILNLIPVSATVIFVITQDSEIDQLLSVARDTTTAMKISKQQVLVHTDYVPPEFKQYKLLTLSWFEDLKKTTSDENRELYNVVYIPDTNETNGECIVTRNRNPNRHQENVCFIISAYRWWKQKKFYKALQLGLSAGFHVKYMDTSVEVIVNQGTCS
ncbi:uncharacterized protein LOC132545849 [Ylistrum balloti]|uniref:uncharacterized protein LOC132545849 n=1 Tax=Ylistrum balloti TaxID=509963 RepID=UPI0029058B69|nr:uncharacterized protein LOC132545849 [Ylistrum balloti]